MKQVGKNKGFTLVELAVVIAAMAVMIAVLAPSLLRYVEDSRIQKDESAMDEVCHSVQLAMSDVETFDEVFEYSIENNYITYSDSSGVYGAQYTDEEFWAPDGSAHAVTITFNPDENGNYDIAKGLVNDMTKDNGSVAEPRVVEGVKQCTLEEMGNQKLYTQLQKTLGATFSEKSATYQGSSYTVFIKFDTIDGITRVNVHGSFNGTNLSPDCPAAVGSGTNDYTPEGEANVTKPNGGTTTPNFDSSDLNGGGGITNTDDNLNNNNTPSEPEMDLNPDDGTTPSHMDVYLAGDYRYNYYYWEEGWTVQLNPEVADKNQVRYGPILESINGVPVTNMNATFYECINLVEAPAIPSGITKMSHTFHDCTSLSKAPVLPQGVRELSWVFVNCTNLKEAPVIPNSVVDMPHTFAYSGLESAPVLPDSVTSLSTTFAGCVNLTRAPAIPNGVGLMNNTFMNCVNLTEAPVIPSSVVELRGTFSGCTRLTGTVVINSTNITDYEECFVDTVQPIYLTGSSSQLHEIAEANNNNNVFVQ